MASITTAQQIIDDAETILSDTLNERWTEIELLAWVNAGMKEICLVKSDAYIKSESFTLAAGTVQSLPAGGFQLMTITHNRGVSPGTTDGAMIKLTDVNILNNVESGWRSATPAATVKYYMYDERFPTQFFVSPPQPASAFGFVWGIYCAVPTEIIVSAVILISDIYRNVLLDYVLYRAYMKDADYTTNSVRCVAHYQAFTNALGIRRELELKEDPNLRKRPSTTGNAGMVG